MRSSPLSALLSLLTVAGAAMMVAAPAHANYGDRDIYFQNLATAGLAVSDPVAMERQGHEVCDWEDQGSGMQGAAASLSKSVASYSPAVSWAVTEAATHAFCPWNVE